MGRKRNYSERQDSQGEVEDSQAKRSRHEPIQKFLTFMSLKNVEAEIKEAVEAQKEFEILQKTQLDLQADLYSLTQELHKIESLVAQHQARTTIDKIFQGGPSDW